MPIRRKVRFFNKQNYAMSFFKILRFTSYFLLFTSSLSAQPWFNWSYTGPDTIEVGNTCQGTLYWGGDSKIACTPVNPPDQVVISKKLKSISDGYFQGQNVQGGTTVTITYEAKDNQDHTEDFSFTIYFADKAAPVFVPASLPPDISVSCNTTLPSASITATDNCTPTFQIQISQEVNIPDDACGGVYQRIFTAKDQAGNSATYIQNITLLPDNENPVITTGAANFVFDCSTSNAAVAFQNWVQNHGGATATDNCGIAGWTTIPEHPVLSSACNIPTTVIFVVSDHCGNKDSTEATFLIVDEVSPVLETDASDEIVYCASGPESLLVQWLSQYGGAVASDNCLDEESIVKSYIYEGEDRTIAELTGILNEQMHSPSQTVTIGSQTYEGVRAYIPIEFRFSDYCDHHVSASAAFAVLDTTKPLIWAPGVDTTTAPCTLGNIDDDFTQWYLSGAAAAGEDDCDTIFWVGQPAFDDALHILHLSPNTCNQSVTVYFRLSDGSGNLSEDGFEAVYRVKDESGPYFQVQPQNLALECAGSSDSQTALNEWIDRQGDALIEDCNVPTWDHFEWRTAAGEEGSGLFGTGPYPNISDNDCSQALIVYFYAKDECGYTSVDSAYFSVSDTIAPIASQVPADISISCAQSIPPDQPVFTDNCGIFGEVEYQEISTQDPNLLSCGHYTYKITRIWTARDFCGNLTTVSQLVSVIDTLAPEPDAPFVDLELQCWDDINDYLINFSDQCSFVQIEQSGSSTQSPNNEDCEYYNYQIVQNYTVSDACFNTKTYSRTITFVDNTPPEIDNSEPLILNCTDSFQVALVLRTLASDICSDALQIETYRVDVGNPTICSSDNFQKWFLKATDPCGNSAGDTILVNLLDEIPPVITRQAEDLVLYCNNLGGLDADFQSWLDNLAGAAAEDLCGQVSAFVAVEGSYDVTDPATFPGKKPKPEFAEKCDGGNTAQLPVDVVFYDQCFNTVVSKANFIIADTISPRLVSCAPDKEIILTAGECSTNYKLELPAVFDACTNTTTDSLMHVVAMIRSDHPGNSLTPVNDVEIVFDGLNSGSSFSSFGNGILTIDISNADIEANEEYFNIYDENNVLLGQTNHSATQCSSSTTQLTFTESQFEDWIQDGVIRFYAKPNDPSPLDGGYAINDICGGSTISASMMVKWNNNPSLRYSYALDTLDAKEVDLNNLPELHLNEGHHTIAFTVKDCGDNAVACTQQIFVRDIIPPVIKCGNDISVKLTGVGCDTLLTIPLPLSMTDNCGLANDFNLTIPLDTASAWLTFAANPNLQNYIAQDMTYTFTNVSGNVTSPVLLNVFIKGDVDSGGEYFTIYGEDGESLGTTEPGLGNVLTGSCTKVSTAYFNIPAAKFNAWALDGKITFNAVSNVNFNIPPGNQLSGINPCGSVQITQDGQTDSTSFMFMQMKYTTFSPPSYFATGATQISLAELQPPYHAPKHKFNAGITYFSYTISDISGNADTCTIKIDVRDTIAPTAVCKYATLHIHPSGIYPGKLTPELIDGGSYDNCRIDSMYVSHQLFNCGDIGTQPEVTLYVKDPAGLIDSCKTQVLIDKALLEPGYSLGLCDKDTLRLFANMPDLNLFDQYIYNWTGPNNFSSNVRNPVIPSANSSHSGTYKLQVTGFNGCGGEGVVQVFINDEINTPIITVKDTTVCDGGNIILNTQTYTGNIKYKWYEGFAPNGVLVDSTIVPQFIVKRAPGEYFFYVVVSENDCVSNPSASASVTVMSNPVALVDEPIISICEGGSIRLGSPLGVSYNYQWNGPNGFKSNEQYPPVISPASLNNAGVYSLVVSLQNCKSAPATVTVSVSPRPEKPVLSSNSPVCTDGQLILTSNVSVGIDTFIWKRPDGSLYVSTTNPFTIDSANQTLSGLWTLTLKSGGCTSLESNPANIEVTPQTNIVIQYESPVCEGDSVRLTTNPFPGATFKWTGPNGFASTAANPKVKAAPGTYAVTVTTAAGCVFSGNIILDLRQRPQILSLSTNAHECQYPDEVINFNFVTNIPEDELSFIWRGPGGFESTQAHPSIIASQLANGVYAVVATSTDGCVSDTTRITIAGTLAPEKPIIQGRSKMCSGDTLTLTATNLPLSGKYYWSTPNGEITTTSNQLSIVNIQPSNGGVFSVVFEVGACKSRSSDGFTVEVVKTPDKPVIIGDPTICLGDSIVLQISNAPTYQYIWSGPGGISSSNEKWVIFPSQQSNAGNYLLTLVNDGCTSKTSDPFIVTIITPPPAPKLVDPGADICISGFGQSLTLCIDESTATPGASYTFFNTGKPKAIAGPTNALCANVTNFSQFNDGINILYATSTLNTCTSAQGIPVQINVSFPPEDFAVTGKVKVACDGNKAILTANTPNFSNGLWTSLTRGAVIANPTSPDTEVSGLSFGENIFVWSLSYNNCKDFSRDTMIVWVPDVLKAVDDVYRTSKGLAIDLDVLANDIFNVPVSIQVTEGPLFGAVEVKNGNVIEYSPAAGNDYDKLTYRLCAEGCPELCVTAKVVIDVDEAGDCRVPNIITPNNDGINDYLRIPCLDGLTNNTSSIVIFNEWGGQVFEASPYLNNWDGKYKGSDLPPGTYFYIFDKGDQSPVQKGFLIIKR